MQGGLVKAGGVTNIEWTPSGKVRKVTKSTGSPLEFRYDAAGNRVEKKQGTVITRYIRDASGNVMAVYQADTISERPIYGSSRLGNLSYASKPGYRTVGHKQYELSNNLGNVLAVVSDRIRMKTDSTWTQVLSRTDYYPFGLEMTGRTESAGYRYGFNGKEKDPSGQWSNQSHYDYGFRIYNPSVGKFLSVDPLTSKYPMLTPYQFASNRPIDGVDLDGLEWQPFWMTRLAFVRQVQDHHVQSGISPKSAYLRAELETYMLQGAILAMPALIVYGAEEFVEELAGIPLIPGPEDFLQKFVRSSIPKKGSLSGANFAQNKFRTSEIFSDEGIDKFSQLAKKPIKTIDDLAESINQGLIKLDQIPIDYVVNDNGVKLILNTRTSTALERAGVPRSEWYGIDRTGVQVPNAPPGFTYNDLAKRQINNNKLPENGATEIFDPKRK